MTVTSQDRKSGKPSQAESPAANPAWIEFLQVYPIYAALAAQFELPAAPYPKNSNPTPWPDRKISERDNRWLSEIDSRLQAVHLRQFLATPSIAKEESLRAFLRRHLLKLDKTAIDRDKIDLLVVQYFVLCAPAEVLAKGAAPEDVAAVLRPVLGEVEPAPLECCEHLDRLLATAQQCRDLRDFVEQGLLDQSRVAKEVAGNMFYDPAALVSFCRFNFLFRRIFIQFLHGDLLAIGKALTELERRGITVVDCRNAGLDAQQTVASLHEFRHRWKAPAKVDYSQPAAFRSYEQLYLLRVELENALGIGTPHVPAQPAASSLHPEKKSEGSVKPQPPKPAIQEAPRAPKKSAEMEDTQISSKALASAEPSADKPLNRIQPTTPARPQTPARPASASVVLSPEDCEEKIWEQLIATPPAPGRSMTTVSIDETRVLLSAWEVAAFVNGSGSDSENLRRAIVARALLTIAAERWKRFMDVRTLHDALSYARDGVSRFQDQIEQLKRKKNVEGAVNLGISLKRLLSVVESAEQLQAGGSTQEPRQ